MTPVTLCLLAAAGFAAGIINTVAGGGSFLTLPGLLLSGLDPRAANMTSTLALFPMQVTTGYATRQLAGGSAQLSFRSLVLISIVGGILGAVLLLLTPSDFFGHLVPWLILFATSLFAYGSFVKKPAALGASSMGRRGAVLCQFGISIYGGYFGGGIGFLMLAALTLGGMAIKKAGATKNILAAAINLAAVVVFMLSPDIGWLQVVIVAVASVLGGLVAVRLVHLVNERFLRIAVILIGVALTIAMFIYY